MKTMMAVLNKVKHAVIIQSTHVLDMIDINSIDYGKICEVPAPACRIRGKRYTYKIQLEFVTPQKLLIEVTANNEKVRTKFFAL